MTQPPTDPIITARVLPPTEFHRLKFVGGPLAQYPLPEDVQALVNVLEVDGDIKAYWVLFDAVHAEPLWADPEVRGNPRAAMALMQQVYTELQSRGIQSVYAIVDADNHDFMEPMVSRLGFRPFPGTLYVAPVEGP